MAVPDNPAWCGFDFHIQAYGFRHGALAHGAEGGTALGTGD